VVHFLHQYLDLLSVVWATVYNQAQSEYKHSLTFCIQRYVVIATKPVHQLQVHPIVHKWRAPPTFPQTYIRVHAVMLECGKGQTDRHTDGDDQYTFRLGYASCEM